MTEVDRETGQVSILRYVAVDDCGNIINPLLVDGQVHGGVAQGMGQALYEQAVYDDNGQLLSGELMDYAIPKAHHDAVDRKRPHGDALAREPAGREGRGRSGHHRGLAGRGELGGRCAESAGRAAHRHAHAARKDLETGATGRSGMIAQNFEYSAPNTLPEALQLLADGTAKVLAGGMSLIPMMKLRLAAPEHLVDLRRVPDLKTISESSGEIHIGAMATHYDLESSPLLRQRCPLLAEAAGHIGDVQVRNMGTIGGSVSHADPAADYPASLLALGAKVRLGALRRGPNTQPGRFLVGYLHHRCRAGRNCP